MAMLHVGVFTSTELAPEGDEFVPTDIDEAGERKVTPDGHLLGGREYCINTFLLPDRGNKLFMMATECAKELNYRDSYLLFNKNKSLYKLIATQRDKETLISAGLLPYSFRSRQIALVTARSMFCQFGSRIIKGGKRVRDDYWEGKAIEQGFTEKDPVISDKKALAAHQQMQLQQQQMHAMQTGGHPPQPMTAAAAVAAMRQPHAQHQPQQPRNNFYHFTGPESAPHQAAAQANHGYSSAMQTMNSQNQYNLASNDANAAMNASQRSAAVTVAQSAAARAKPDTKALESLQQSQLVLQQLVAAGNVSGVFVPGSDIAGAFDYQDGGSQSHHHIASLREQQILSSNFSKNLNKVRESRNNLWSSFWVGRLDSNREIIESEQYELLTARDESADPDQPMTDPTVLMINQRVKGELEKDDKLEVVFPDPPLVQKVRHPRPEPSHQMNPTNLVSHNMGPMHMGNPMAHPNTQGFKGRPQQQLYYPNGQQAKGIQIQQQRPPHQNNVNWRGQPAAWNNYH